MKTFAGKLTPTAELPIHLSAAVTECTDVSHVLDETSISQDSVDYTVRDVFHTGYKEAMALFGKIEQIVIAGDEIFLSVLSLSTLYFSKHRSAYIVAPSDIHVSYHPGQFEDHHPLDMYEG